MAPMQRAPSVLAVMAQATSPSPRLWPPEACNEHTSLKVHLTPSR